MFLNRFFSHIAHSDHSFSFFHSCHAPLHIHDLFFKLTDGNNVGTKPVSLVTEHRKAVLASRSLVEIFSG